MSVRKISRYKPSSGFLEGGDNPKISIKFDRDDFEQIRLIAENCDISFAAAVRVMCKQWLTIL